MVGTVPGLIKQAYLGNFTNGLQEKNKEANAVTRSARLGSENGVGKVYHRGDILRRHV